MMDKQGTFTSPRMPWAFLTFTVTAVLALLLWAVFPTRPLIGLLVFFIGWGASIGWAIYRRPRKPSHINYSDRLRMDRISITPEFITDRVATEFLIPDSIQKTGIAHTELWVVHGEELLGREQEALIWGRLNGTGYQTFKPLPAEKNAFLQERNITLVEEPVPFIVKDVNTYTPHELTALTLVRSTVFVSPFMASRYLSITPKHHKLMKHRTGNEERLVGEPSVDKKYSLHTTDLMWARLLLTPDILQILCRDTDLSLAIENNEVTIRTSKIWLPISRYPQIIDLLTFLNHNLPIADTHAEKRNS